MSDCLDEYTQYVQAKFFKTGLYTHLYLSTSSDETGEGLRTQWVFTFQDLGSTHTISRDVSLTLSETTSEVCMDGVCYATLDQAEHALFDGYYADYVRDLYLLEGIQV